MIMFLFIYFKISGEFSIAAFSIAINIEKKKKKREVRLSFRLTILESLISVFV